VSGASAVFGETAALFSESASRVVVSVAPAQLAALLALATAKGLPARQIGRVAGKRIQISVVGKQVVNELVSEAERIWATAIESWFEQRLAIA